MNDLIKKYNRPGPRYTSYPPVPFWNNTPDEKNWLEHVLKNYDPSTGVDLYVHVPYCESLCYYCGCNRIITKNHNVEDDYVDLLLREWEIYQQRLGFIPVINSLHFGGGTPTFLSPENLDKVIKTLIKNKQPGFIGSIEIDPRTCQSGHLKVLNENGILRVSLGIQDFDPVVQKAIHREQPVAMVEALVWNLRSSGISSINFDLVYGLPKQTSRSIHETIKEVIKLGPDLIAFYSYAHLPDRIKNQKLIKEEDLPGPELKRELYEVGKGLLLKEGYVDVGMDHFARPGSYLFEAQKNETLHRNFMGYVDKKSPILIGLGPTSISDSSLSFIQNMKELKDYEKKVRSGHLPIEKGHTHTNEDLLVQEIILDLMCKNRAQMNKGTLPYWKEITQELKNFQADGLLDWSDEDLVIPEKGKPFIRNIAMSFDYHLREKNPATKFSQTI